MKKVLITGAAGFIGSNLSSTLILRGDCVIGVDNFDDFYEPSLKRKNIAELIKSPSFKLLEGDIRDKFFINNVLHEHKPDVVVHLAARAGVRPSIEQPELYYDVNVTGTLILLEAMKANNLKNLVFASSSSVYGNNEKTPFSEDDNVDNPISPYAATKKTGELLCYTYHHLYDFNTFCLRFFTVYGHNQRPEMAIQQFGRLIREGKTLMMYGDGSTRRDYTYIDDIVYGIVSSIDHLKGYEVINLGNNQTIALKELIDMISEILGISAKIEKRSMQPGDVNITFADISKANRLLGYNPQFPIKEGLKRMFKDYVVVKQ